jgi:hypothetical protein
MVRVVLRGGLGNQLWQLNAAFMVAARSGRKLELDRSFLDAYMVGTRQYWLDSFDLASMNIPWGECRRPKWFVRSQGPMRRLQRAGLRLNEALVVSARTLHEDVAGRQKAVARLLEEGSEPALLIGYFEDERLMALSQAMGFPTPLPLRSPTVPFLRSLESLRSAGAASLHIRLGDFPVQRRISPALLMEFIGKSVQPSERPDALWIFSDQPRALEAYLQELRGGFRDVRIWSGQWSPPELVHLMSASSLLITGDSTFGQWAGHWCRAQGGRWLVAPLNSAAIAT